MGEHTSTDAAAQLRLVNLRHDRGAANGLDVKQAEQIRTPPPRKSLLNDRSG